MLVADRLVGNDGIMFETAWEFTLADDPLPPINAVVLAVSPSTVPTVIPPVQAPIPPINVSTPAPVSISSIRDGRNIHIQIQ